MVGPAGLGVKVYVATIAWRSLHPSHVFSLIDLLSRPGLLWGPVAGDALVERSRGRCATDFLLRSDADVLLSVDTDVVFRTDDALAICEQAMDTATPIVAGVYMTRGRQGGRPTSTLAMDVRYDFALTDPATTVPVPIKYAAGGFMAVHRRVFEALAADLPLCHRGNALEHYPFYLPFVVDGEDGPELLSEDYALCERARRAGFETFANPAVRLEHVGEQGFVLEDMLQTHDTPTQPLALTRTARGWVVEHNERNASDG